MSHWSSLLIMCVCVATLFGAGCALSPATASAPGERISLPAPRTTGDVSLEEALASRRSIRQYGQRPLTWEEIGQLLWAAQGVTSPRGFRTAPSAGALYPLELYVVLPEGVFHYEPVEHELSKTAEGDHRKAVGNAALKQSAIYDAPALFVIAAVYERTAVKYGDRAERYVKMEAGHAAQNLLLQMTVLGLGAVPIGAFYDERVQSALGLSSDEMPLYLIPVGALPDQ